MTDALREETIMGPLSHLTVLDMSRILAGPWAGQLLGDYGAEVVKIERPGTGDDTRGWGPPWVPGADGQPTDDAAYFLCANRNKRSVTVDFTRPGGQELLHGLARTSDVLIENFKVGGLKPYRLDYESLRAINPRLIYCSITGFGQTGPYAPRPGYDFMIQGMGGLMSITGRRDDEPGGGPQKVGVALTDVLTGLYATTAILAALAHRERTGEGQHIDLSLMDVQVASLANQAQNVLVTGVAPKRLGNAHPSIVPYQDFPTADGSFIVAVGTDRQFARLVETAGHPEWASDPRFRTNRDRVANRDAFAAAFSAVSVERTTAEWVTALEVVGVPCGPINDLEAVFAHPQVLARGMRVELPHGAGGAVPLTGNPVKLSATPTSYRLAPPLLGADTRAVLAERLGLSEAELDALAADGLV